MTDHRDFDQDSPLAPPRDGYFSVQPASAATVLQDILRTLIQQLEADRTQYLATLDRVYATLNDTLQRQHGGTNSLSEASSPGDLTIPSFESHPAMSKAAHGKGGQSPASGPGRDRAPHGAPNFKGSIFTGEDSSESEDDESFFAQEPLPPRDYSEADLLEHLKSHTWDVYSKYILQDLLRNISLLENGIFLKDRHHQTDANHQHADIYHIGTDGAPLRLSRGDSDEGPLAAWEALKSINCDESRKQAVGRIIVVREPPSSLLAALHLTMKEHLDMDSLFRILVDDHTPTKALVKGCLKPDHRRQRSVAFVFKYHCLIGENRTPLPWQNHDDLSEPPDGHIPLSTCSSVVALSLAGRPSHTLRRNSRKRKSIVGHVYDPFAPWLVLSIQCFPDWNSSVEVHETSHHYVNGPDAFLATLLSEYRDAVKRFKEVHSRIQELATPPNSSIFDNFLRDELLFENDKYTYTRRYFWASQTLGLLSNEIKAMIAAYKETFTDDVWNGEHKMLFPGTRAQSPRYNNWRKKLGYTRRQFENEISQLEDVLHTFQQQQKEIRGLREWLFSGTSVLESREAVSMAKITVDQGYNIRLLTLVTLFYLPLTFVTSIYGMTNMPPNGSFIPFALTTVGICVPTYLLILIVSNPEDVRSLINKVGLVFTTVTSCAAPKKSDKLRAKILERRIPHPDQRRPTMHTAATHASLEARLSQDLTIEPSLRGSMGLLQATRRMSQSISNYFPGMARRPSQAPPPVTLTSPVPGPKLSPYAEELSDLTASRQRVSIVKFDEPHYSPARRRAAESDSELKLSSPIPWRTADSNGSTLRDVERAPSTMSPSSPFASPLSSEPIHRTDPTAPDTDTAADDARSRSVSPTDPEAPSIFRRLNDRFAPRQVSPRQSNSESQSPMEDV